jgi:hypothetical protein
MSGKESSNLTENVNPTSICWPGGERYGLLSGSYTGCPVRGRYPPRTPIKRFRIHSQLQGLDCVLREASWVQDGQTLGTPLV